MKLILLILFLVSCSHNEKFEPKTLYIKSQYKAVAVFLELTNTTDFRYLVVYREKLNLCHGNYKKEDKLLSLKFKDCSTSENKANLFNNNNRVPSSVAFDIKMEEPINYDLVSTFNYIQVEDSYPVPVEIYYINYKLEHLQILNSF